MIICDEFVTRMSSRPVLSSQPRKVELLETLINNYVTIEMENRKIGRKNFLLGGRKCREMWGNMGKHKHRFAHILSKL